MLERKRPTYDEMLELHPNFSEIFSRNSWDFLGHSDKRTIKRLAPGWLDNMKINIKSKRFRKHGSILKDLTGFGKNKAIIAIGAGKSFNKNKEVLKAIHDIDGVKDIDDRDFLFVASNHMFKPLLKMGIIPDFVFIADAADIVVPQLTEDIPESGRNTILIAGLHCSPKALKRWDKQGRDIRFYVTSSPGVGKLYKELTGKSAKPITIYQGGNVLNTIWTVGLFTFESSVFMGVGNDLSYEMHDEIDNRRATFYADGDYSSNIQGVKRDEAKGTCGWMGFSLSKSNIISMNAEERYNVELEPVGTTGTFWVYKTWIESNVLAMANNPINKFMYYNCSEGGIVGVMCKTEISEERENIENWFLMDSVCKKWRTRTLEEAVKEFMKAKGALRWGIQRDVPNAISGAIQV